MCIGYNKFVDHSQPVAKCIQYSSSVMSHVLASNSRGAREFRVSDSREPCV